MTQFNATVRSYQDADNYLGARQERPIGHNTRIVRVGTGISIRYHGSPVVRFTPDSVDRPGEIILDSCGWKTFTTKERMNAFAPRGFRISQERGIWHLWNYDTQVDYIFKDGIRISTQGVVSCAGDPSENERVKKLTRQIRQYAQQYARELCAGHVPAPSSGDCWDCLMQDEDGTSLGKRRGSDHLMLHIQEKYYVPSLLLRALQLKPCCNFTRGILGQLWGGTQGDPLSEWEISILSRDVIATIAHYLKHELGIAG